MQKQSLLQSPSQKQKLSRLAGCKASRQVTDRVGKLAGRGIELVKSCQDELAINLINNQLIITFFFICVCLAYKEKKM